MEEFTWAVQDLGRAVGRLSTWALMSFTISVGIFLALMVLVGYRMIFFILRYGDRKRK